MGLKLLLFVDLRVLASFKLGRVSFPMKAEKNETTNGFIYDKTLFRYLSLLVARLEV
jgi:hypothetical protein